MINIYLNNQPYEAVSKALPVRFTPKSPKGDLLIFSTFLYPPWRAGGKKRAFETPSYPGIRSIGLNFRNRG